MSESKSIEVQLLNTVEAVRSEAIKESLEIANTCLQEHDHSGGQEHGQAMCIYSALQERAGRSGNPRESLRRDLHCSCGAACAPEEYEQHVQMGHDQGEILHRDSVSASSAEPEESLLPCPFCGRAPTIKEVRFTAEVLAASPEPKSYWWIGCEIDAHITGCGIGHSSIDKQEAIRKWNTRAANTAVPNHERCAKIAEAVNDSIKTEGKAAAAILNPNTCIVPLSGGGTALQPEHVFDNEGLCVYCSERSDTAVPQCTWTLNDFDGSFDTLCGEKFSLDSGTPEENKMRWCCYCGKTLVSLPPSPAE